MIIGISGKIGSGKDTIGRIIQILTDLPHLTTDGVKSFLKKEPVNPIFIHKKCADKLKDMVCLLLNCTREQLEDHEFKNTELGEEWTKYAYAKGFWYHSDDNPSHKMMDSVSCTKEEYEEEKRINWQTAYKRVLTPRLLMQLIGTECGRDIIHPDIWVNSLMSEYMDTPTLHNYDNKSSFSYPNWVITDMRFPNELAAVKSKEGISIRVERYPKEVCVAREGGIGKVNQMIPFDKNNPKHMNLWKGECARQHESEKALDNSLFHYTIDNNGTIEELIEQVKEILIKEKIINT